jgi:hypothetical protein
MYQEMAKVSDRSKQDNDSWLIFPLTTGQQGTSGEQMKAYQLGTVDKGSGAKKEVLFYTKCESSIYAQGWAKDL